MGASEKRIFHRACNGDRRYYCLFLILALGATFDCSALAQPGPLFYRTDYLLHKGLDSPSGLVIADLNNDGKLDFAVGEGRGINVALGNGDSRRRSDRNAIIC